METSKLKKFSQFARRNLMEQVASKLDYVLAIDSEARRGNVRAVEKLEKSISETSKEQVVERVAYIWFNRFCALRFMDVNRYSRIGVISPAEGQFQPEILAEAKMGHIDDEMVGDPVRQQVFTLLDGKSPSRDPQGEAYRLLIVAVCNYWHKAMPFLFERIEDYTELLMPDDLLSGNSILAYTREAMTPDTCKDVEVIGWLYQFYISEKKDDVFAGLKKNKKVTPENIPAATQLFTPNYIVRYLVENSLGRLWMLNNPSSSLPEKMDFYIAPETPETTFLRITSPEKLKICDPACGSGHMLSYSFDLLYAIYEESGYNASEIPSLILKHNLYGIELDERAGELAAFALVMKAREKQRRFFRKPVQPNICVLENIELTEDERRAVREEMGADLITGPYNVLLSQFEEADNFGSLIRPAAVDISAIEQQLQARAGNTRLFFDTALAKMKLALKQADYLSPKYHIMVANPPYMGSKGMNGRLGKWAKDNYSNSKSDLFTMFMERGMDLIVKNGMVAMINMQSWMFLSSFEKLRTKLLNNFTILTMAHLGARAFDSIGGEVVSTTAFVVGNQKIVDHQGDYLRLVDGKSETEKITAIKEAIKNPDCGWFYRASATDFSKISGSPLAYWLPAKSFILFSKAEKLSDIYKPKVGLNTTDNGQFLRLWHEVSIGNAGFGLANSKEAQNSKKRWFPYNKGGSYRRWFGNFDYFVNWWNDGYDIKTAIANDPAKQAGGRVVNEDCYFLPSLSWSLAGAKIFSVRFSPKGAVFDVGGSSIFPDENRAFCLAAFLSSSVSNYFMAAMNPTFNFQAGNVAALPILPVALNSSNAKSNTAELIQGHQSDWDAFETSWDFTTLPLLHPDTRQPTLAATYASLRAHWQQMTDEMQRLEEENNRIFIDAYGLADELTPDVPLAEITLTCNPAYRYGGKNTEADLETKLRADTLREFISYAVGCMFGRYALEKEGLILANQGETFEDYLARVPDPSFPADDDNVIPILDGDWFTDGISDRFKQFLRLTFGDEHYEENLQFIEGAIGKDIRKYFLKDFYTDHWKRYKKRPIYWMFSSPKGSFNALIYMHRYRPDTVSVVLNDYLREFRTKLAAHKSNFEAVSISASASQGDKTKALKEIEKINSMITEMEEHEREILYPLATRQIEIDLDDGVKVNYPKFGKALKKITGLS